MIGLLLNEKLFKLLNMIFAGLGLLILVWLVLELVIWVPQKSIDKLNLPVIENNKGVNEEQEMDLLSKDYQIYEKTLSKKTLFKAAPEGDEKAEPDLDFQLSEDLNALEQAEQDFQEALPDLRLVGVMRGQKKRAVIEDMVGGHVYYSNEGDYLSIGGVKDSVVVKEVHSDHVVLEHNDEPIVLSL